MVSARLKQIAPRPEGLRAEQLTVWARGPAHTCRQWRQSVSENLSTVSLISASNAVMSPEKMLKV